MTVELDQTRAPILYITYRGDIRDEDVQSVVETVHAWTNQKRSYALVVDTLQCGPPSAKQRKILASAFENRADDDQRYLRACGVAIGSAIVRGAMTAMIWIGQPRFPLAVLSSVAEAEAFVRSKLANER